MPKPPHCIAWSSTTSTSSPRLVEIMQNWVHPGFSVFQGEVIAADDPQARRRVAGYIVHPPIALERLRYRPETAQVIYYGRQREGCSDAEASPAREFSSIPAAISALFPQL